MDIEKIKENYKIFSDKDEIMLKGLLISDDIYIVIASEEKGILPHDIANNSILLVDKKASYKKGDYILIKDKRVEGLGQRITKALSENDKDFIGKLVMAIKIY